jgi:hypothetical protein
LNQVEIKRRYENILLSKQFVNGCAVGFKERKGSFTSEICVVAYVVQKRGDMPPEQLVQPSLDGVKTDVQENPPVGPLAWSPFAAETARADIYYCRRYECMEYQKMKILEQNLTSTLDLLTSVLVTRDDIINAAKKTRLWPILQMQLSEYERYGEPIRGPGQSSGFLGIPADKLPFPDAGLFMKKLRRITQRRRKKSVTIPAGYNTSEIGLAGKTVQPELGMDVIMQGVISGVARGKIVGVDASVFVDYAPWMGTEVMGEPCFSPSPLHGGYFPIDIVGLTDRAFKPRYPPEPQDCPYRKLFKTVRHYRRALFVGQIVTTVVAKQGDSGAPLCDEKGNPVGMLFGGTQRFSYFHPARLVGDELGASFMPTK